MTKIDDIPYPIYDLIKNSKPYMCYNSWRICFLIGVILVCIFMILLIRGVCLSF